MDKKRNKSHMSITFYSAFTEKTFPFLSSWLSPEHSDRNILWRMHALNNNLDGKYISTDAIYKSSLKSKFPFFPRDVL